jgi:hypothetical protein
VVLPPQVIEIVSGLVAGYIESNRRKYMRLAVPLPTGKQTLLSPFFPADVLSDTRSVAARPRLLNPSFYSQLRALGIKRLPEIANVAAITFIDVIVHQAPLTNDLLFHELVHIIQYRKLGLEEFARLYVKGFLVGGSYAAIPLERQAYALEARFTAAPHLPFSVEDEVSRAIQDGSF